MLWSQLFLPSLCAGLRETPYPLSHTASPSHIPLTPSILQAVNHRSVLLDSFSPSLYFLLTPAFSILVQMFMASNLIICFCLAP